MKLTDAIAVDAGGKLHFDRPDIGGDPGAQLGEVAAGLVRVSVALAAEIGAMPPNATVSIAVVARLSGVLNGVSRRGTRGEKVLPAGFVTGTTATPSHEPSL